MSLLVFTLVPHGSDAYLELVALRQEILRTPLGLRFTPEELAAEKDYLHIAAMQGDILCATAMLVPKGTRYKMQRVAVREGLQGQGIGSSMMEYCEAVALERGVHTIYCHARETAVPFYLKLGYIPQGQPFDEQGIPHLKMSKTLGG